MPIEPFKSQIGTQVEVTAEDIDDPQRLADKVELAQLETDNPIVWQWFED